MVSLALTMLGSVSTCIQRISLAVTAEPIKGILKNYSYHKIPDPK